MSNKLSPARSIYFPLVSALLLLFCAGAAEAQTDCAATIAKARQRVQSLEETVAARDQTISDQRTQINLRDQMIDQLRAKIDQQQALIDAQNSKVGELQKQIATLEDSLKLAQQNAQLQQNIAAINAQFIDVQKEAIRALVQTGKRSAVEKLVDSLPSIASIIAVALTHK